MLAAVAVAAAAAVGDGAVPFPPYPSQFAMTESLWLNTNNTAAPNMKRAFVWDTTARRSWMQSNSTTATPGRPALFELQIRRCDTSPQVYYDVKGDPSADPSTYTCVEQRGASIMTCAGSSWQPFWFVPKDPVWNGTASINGVTCDRFELANPLGRQTFWGTPTAPCRAFVSHGSGTGPITTQEDYTLFSPGPPPIAEFAIPAWLAALKCKLIPAGAELPAGHRPHGPM